MPRLKQPPRGISRSFVLGSGYGALAWLCQAVSHRENRCCGRGGTASYSVIRFVVETNA